MPNLLIDSDLRDKIVKYIASSSLPAKDAFMIVGSLNQLAEATNVDNSSKKLDN